VQPEPGDVEVRPGGMPVLDATEAARLARDGLLLDARAPERYRGDVEPVDPRAGHIPGARNAPFAGHLGGNARWQSPAALADRFREIGVRADEPIGAYCGSGVTASSVVLALEVAGLTTPTLPAALYAGSWSHWCVDESRPVATGANPG
jgi:thiosulfate/3-mercaptopyruvate sulfurtransferase